MSRRVVPLRFIPRFMVFSVVRFMVFFSCRVPGRSRGQETRAYAIRRYIQRKVFARSCRALCQAVWQVQYLYFSLYMRD